MGSYIPATAAEQQEMLTACGVHSVEDLFAVVPEDVRLKELNIPSGLTELEVAEKMTALAEKNKRFSSVFRGAGAYKHYIPAIVKTITSKEEFVTAYTPYQAEISQGVLQSIFEYQTQMCELMGVDVANASVYDGATAAAEAVFTYKNANAPVLLYLKQWILKLWSCSTLTAPAAMFPLLLFLLKITQLI